MELVFRNDLELHQTQKLTMTPELIQSLNILQLGSAELLEYIYDRMEENPVIDIEEAGMDDRQLVLPTETEPYDTDSDCGEYKTGGDYGEYDSADSGAPFEEYLDSAGGGESWDAGDWYSYSERMGYEDDAYYGRYTYDSEISDRYDYMNQHDMTLEENLKVQLDLCSAPFMVKAVADYIIQTLDDNGYMTNTVSELANELQIDDESVMEGLRLVWTLDPVGVGARSLAECLELQLKSIGRFDDIFGIIVERHLEDIAMNRLSSVAKATGLSVYEVQERADILRSLEPKPGREYAVREETKYIIPDVRVEIEGGKPTAILNKTASPHVVIRNEYRNMLRDADKNSNVALFLSDRFNAAKWLIDTLEHRKNTILMIAQEIVDRQRAFFREGKGALRPLTMKEIAESAGVHESTVSRTVNGKYLQCDQGVFELKYFFSGTGRLASVGGGSESSESLKVLIKKLVKTEDNTMPMSDQSLADAILITGVRISRRTVAKYREELGIPSSSVRKRLVR